MAERLSYSGNIKHSEIALVTQAAAFAAGDLLASKIVIPNVVDEITGGEGKRTAGGACWLQSLSLIDLAAQSASCELWLFDSDPSNTTFTVNGAWALAAADADKIIPGGIIPISNWYPVASSRSIAAERNLALPIVLPAGATDLYGALIGRGTPTYAATSDLTLRVAISRDR